MSQADIAAYIEDGPHGGNTIEIRTTDDGTPPPEIHLADVPEHVAPSEEPSLRHSRSPATCTYRLVDRPPRDGIRYIYRLTRARDSQKPE